MDVAFFPVGPRCRTARVVRSRRAYDKQVVVCQCGCGRAGVDERSGLPQGQGATLVDHVNPRPAAAVCARRIRPVRRGNDGRPAERVRSLDGRDRPSAAPGDGTSGTCSSRARHSPRACCSTAATAGADRISATPAQPCSRLLEPARLHAVRRQPRSGDGRQPLGAGDGARARLAVPVLDCRRASCDRTVAGDRADRLGRHEPPRRASASPVPQRRGARRVGPRPRRPDAVRRARHSRASPSGRSRTRSRIYDAIIAAHAYAGSAAGWRKARSTATSRPSRRRSPPRRSTPPPAYRTPTRDLRFTAARLRYATHASWPGYLTNQFGYNVHQLAPVFGDARRGPTGSALYHRAHRPAARQALPEHAGRARGVLGREPRRDVASPTLASGRSTTCCSGRPTCSRRLRRRSRTGSRRSDRSSRGPTGRTTRPG